MLSIDEQQDEARESEILTPLHACSRILCCFGCTKSLEVKALVAVALHRRQSRPRHLTSARPGSRESAGIGHPHPNPVSWLIVAPHAGATSTADGAAKSASSTGPRGPHTPVLRHRAGG